jgi:hypothetical protein
MDGAKVELTRTELDFLRRLLLDLQRNLGGVREGGAEERIAAIELALAMLQWDGDTPPELDAQVGLGAAVQLKLGADAMCAYHQWRTERRRRPVLH